MISTFHNHRVNHDLMFMVDKLEYTHVTLPILCFRTPLSNYWLYMSSSDNYYHTRYYMLYWRKSGPTPQVNPNLSLTIAEAPFGTRECFLVSKKKNRTVFYEILMKFLCSKRDINLNLNSIYSTLLYSIHLV